MANTLNLQAPAWCFWQPGNVAEREQFIAAHDQRHRTYKLAASRAGRALSSCVLTGEMNEDWFARHLLCHAAHQRIFPREVVQSSNALEMPSDEEGAILSWMRRHALIHAALDVAYGVVK